MKLPFLPLAFLDGFLTCNFLGYDLNVGKRPRLQIDIFISANNNIAIVAALMLTTSMPFSMEAAANGGYGMEGIYLGLYHVFCFGSGGVLMCCMILCIILNLAAGQLSNETEITYFFQALGNYKVWPMRLMCIGCWLQFAMYTNFMAFNNQVGAAWDTPLYSYGIAALAIPWTTCFCFMWVVAEGISSLHFAKMQAVELAIRNGEKRRPLEKNHSSLHDTLRGFRLRKTSVESAEMAPT